MKAILLSAAMLLPVSAYAGHDGTSTGRSDPAAVAPSAVASPSLSSGPVTSNSSAAQQQRQRQSVRNRVSNNVTVQNGAGGSGGGYGDRAPDVIGAPLVGANNCAVGLTLGGSGASAGGLFGLLWEGSACARNRDATLLNNMGFRSAGVELLCDTDAIRQAMYRSGSPCRKDIDQYGDAWRKQGWRQ